MSYQAILQKKTENMSYETVAKNTKEYMEKIRQIREPRELRRWVWELLQNAKDAAFPGEPIFVQFELYEDKFVFTHNGKPFSVGNLLTLLQKIGGENEDNYGFSFTHVLSERVRVTGIMQDFHLETGARLPMKNFSLELDRSGTSLDEMAESLDKGIVTMMRLDSIVDVPSDFQDFQTYFTYLIHGERSKKIAQLGMEDLVQSAGYLLAFLPEIGTIRIVNHIKTTTLDLKRGREQRWTDPDLSLFTLQVTENGEGRWEYFILGKQDRTVVALPVDQKEMFFKEQSRDVSRIFAPFPVPFTHEFPLPFVCYDSEFKKTVNGGLGEISNTVLNQPVRDNGVILDGAVALYQSMLREGSSRGYSAFYHVVYFPVLYPSVKIEANWVKSHVYEKIYQSICSVAMFTTSEGIVNLDETLVFPTSLEKEELLGLWNILDLLPHVTMPVLEESIGWCQAFLPHDEMMRNRMMSLEMLLSSLHMFVWKDRSLKLEFLQQVFECVGKNPTMREKLVSGELAIFPDQTLEMNLHSGTDIFLDVGLNEAMKQGILELNEVCVPGNSVSYPIYNLLLHPGFDLKGFDGVKEAPVDVFFSYMREKTWVDPDQLPENELRHLELAVGCFLSCYEDEFWLDLYRKFINPSLALPHVPSTLGEKEHWNNSISLMIHRVATMAEQSKNMTQFGEKYFVGSPPRVVEEYFREFVEKCSAISENIYEYEIFPNQYGEFCLAKNLSNDFDVDEELKRITRMLHHENVPDYYSILFAKYFDNVKYYLVMPKNNESIAQDILRGVNGVLNHKKLSEAEDETKEACILLLSWIEDHGELAEELFSQFSGEENRLKLITPQSAGFLSKKVAAYDGLMMEFGLGNVEELAQVLRRTKEVLPTKPAYIFEEKDVFIDFHEYAVLQVYNLEEREEYVEKVREVGIQCALSFLVKKWESLGFRRLSAIEDGKIVLENLDNKVIIQRFEGDKQRGWQMSETVNQSPSVYYAVKTTVSQEKRDHLQLSEAQMNLAFLMGDNFRVFRYLLTTDLKKVIASKQILNLVEDLKGDQIQIKGEQFHFVCPYSGK